jgi:molecular chaperone Hsp33
LSGVALASAGRSRTFVRKVAPPCVRCSRSLHAHTRFCVSRLCGTLCLPPHPMLRPPFSFIVLSTLARTASALTVPAAQHHVAHVTAQQRHERLRRGGLAAIVSQEQQDEVGEIASSMQEDHIVTAISGDGSISAKAIVTTELVGETSRLQGLKGLAAAAIGRALTCSLLVVEGQEEEETFQVNFRGDGPLRGVLAIANGRLEARGYVGNPAVTLPPNALGKFDVGAGVGKGSLQVVRTKNLPGETVSTPYTSITEIKTGEIPEDINWFLADSEQKEGALAAGVFVQGVDDGVDRNGEKLGGAKVLAAGGWYVQLLPFADDAAVEQLQANLAAMADRSPTEMIRDGLGAEDVIKLLLNGLDPKLMKRGKPASLAASCQCSEERVFRTLRLLPRSEIDDIMEKNEDIQVKCEFCGKRYELTPEVIKADLDAQKAA